MKKTYFLSKITTFILCFILLAGTTTAFAAGKQLMSYNGTGIMAKATVSNFTLSEETTITIDHNQSLNPAYAKYTDARMDVNLQKKELLNIAIPEIQKPAKAVLDLKKIIQNPREHIDYIFLHTNMLIR
jgi:spermidine/putrescine-binding protein